MDSKGMFTIRAAPLVGALAASITLASAAAPLVPDGINAPATQAFSREVRAVGVQIYDCKPAKEDPSRFEWVFRAPEADLVDVAGKSFGKHYAGPTWEASDGSKVVGEVRAKNDGPDASAIPWLLLTAKSTSGAGVLANTASIQRVQTVGGKAPDGGCGQAQAGKEIRVPYSATYYFYVDKASMQSQARESSSNSRGTWSPALSYSY